MASGTGMLLVYIISWGIVFGTFVHYYHKRKAQALSKLEAWYPEHKEREIYYSLISLQKSTPEAVPPATLRAALFRRAMTDIMRALDIKMNKQTLMSLVKSGAMSEELLHQFNAAEAENDAEMMSVVQEAEKLQKGWGGSIFFAASEMVNNTRLRELREEMLRLDFESANCVRSVMLESMSEEERKKATTDGTKENEQLTKRDVILSSIFNMPIGEGIKVAAAAQAKHKAEMQKKEEKANSSAKNKSKPKDEQPETEKTAKADAEQTAKPDAADPEAATNEESENENPAEVAASS
ncbi:translocation protein Sec66 [Coemansia sp. RSA 2336]|nr:translocation protein Sec66 [Coemansia sp. RSA 2336]